MPGRNPYRQEPASGKVWKELGRGVIELQRAPQRTAALSLSLISPHSRQSEAVLSVRFLVNVQIQRFDASMSEADK